LRRCVTCGPSPAALPRLGGVSAARRGLGAKPLLASDADVGDASREHRVIEEQGVITVAGREAYTTFRVMARDPCAA